MTPTLSIVIPAFNEEKALRYTLPKNIQSVAGLSAEIIVVDNNSTDQTAQVAQSFDNVTVVHEGKKGTNAARQAGYKAASGDLIIFVDADTFVSPQWIETTMRTFAKKPSIVALSGALSFYDCPKWYRPFYKLIWYMLFSAYKLKIVKPFVLGTAFAVRRETLDSMDGFNIDLTFYGDDTDIGLRARQHGKVMFIPRMLGETSARRYKQQGVFKTLYAYFISHFSTYLRGKPVHDDPTHYR